MAVSQEHRAATRAVTATPRRGRRTAHWYTSDAAIRIFTLVGVLAVWETIGRSVSTVYFASASRTFTAMYDMTRSGELPEAWRSSLVIMFAALGIAGTLGIVLGFVLGRFQLLDRFFQPVMTAVFMTPKIALLPIIALWLGYATTSKIVVVFMFSFFEIFFTVRNGVRSVDRDYVEVARSYTIPEGMMLRRIVFPATLPFVVTGLRLGLLHGMVGVTLAGFFLENTGIGGVISYYASGFRLAEVFALIITVMFVGVVINVGLRFFERRLAPWTVGRTA